MFDIREYYQNNNQGSLYNSHDLSNIDQDLSQDIDNLLTNRFDKLYERDSFKNGQHLIEIIHPGIIYPGNRSLLLSPDRVRFLLSFYPQKENLEKIDKIVVRPRYIEVGDIELVSLFLKKNKILVIYLCHPHYYNSNQGDEEAAGQEQQPDFVSMDLEKLMERRQNRPPGEHPRKMIHPLWYMLSVITPALSDDDRAIDKFFLKNISVDTAFSRVLNDISFYYSQHGY